MNFVDTHCHLYSEEFKDDVDVELRRAQDSGVNAFILPAIDSESHQQLFDLASKHSSCFPLIGLHPTSVNSSYAAELDVVEKFLSSQNIYGIGEVGVDLYWSKEFEREQRDVFAAQIEFSLQHNLPLVIHSREAFKVIADVLKAFSGKSVFGVFHAFTGDVSMYRTIQTLGDFKVGIGGIVTFKNSGLADAVREIPLEDIVLETDSPYLAPTPYRGKRNTPSYIPLIAQKVAEIKGTTLANVAEVTTLNSTTIFNLPK